MSMPERKRPVQYWRSDIVGVLRRAAKKSLAMACHSRQPCLLERTNDLMRILNWVVFVAMAPLASSILWAADAEKTNQALFGFTGPETFPIENAITQLRAGDIDGDGLMDLVVANNARAKINILFNQTGKTNTRQPAGIPGTRTQ